MVTGGCPTPAVIINNRTTAAIYGPGLHLVGILHPPRGTVNRIVPGANASKLLLDAQSRRFYYRFLVLTYGTLEV